MRTKKFGNTVAFQLLLATSLISATAYSAPPTPVAGSTPDWEYPELLVSPRASERLEREARIEDRRGIMGYWQLALPGLMTLGAGLLQLGSTKIENDPDKDAAKAAMGVGGAWVAASVLMASRYQPFASGLSEISRMPKGTAREQLVRERMAEESIESAASTSRTFKWLSFASNLVTGIYLSNNASPGSLSKIVDLLVVGTAFTPILFQPHAMDVAREQRDYKKRIFGPLVSASWLRTSEALNRPGSLCPGLALSWRF